MGRKCFGVKLNGGILLPPTCEINYDNMQPNYVNMRLFFVNMRINFVGMRLKCCMSR